MRHHNALGPCIYAHTERQQLDLLQALQGVGHNWQTHVRIRRGIPVPRKVLEARDHSRLTIPLHGGCGQARHAGGVLPKRADADNRVGRVVVDIHDGSKVHVYTESTKLPAGRKGDLTRQPLRTCGAKPHVAGEDCRPLPEAAHNAVLLVNADKQWVTVPSLPCDLLKLARQRQQLSGVPHVAGEQNDAADVMVPYQVGDLRRWSEAVKPHDE